LRGKSLFRPEFEPPVAGGPEARVLDSVKWSVSFNMGAEVFCITRDQQIGVSIRESLF
jgi:hypothetical protein